MRLKTARKWGKISKYRLFVEPEAQGEISLHIPNLRHAATSMSNYKITQFHSQC